MRIHRINQNNYQNNCPKRNIGFRMKNANIVIEGLECAYSDLCAPSKKIVIEHLVPKLAEANLAGEGDIIHLIPIKMVESDEKDLRVLAVDDETFTELKSTNDPTQIDSMVNMLIIESTPVFLSAAKVFPTLKGKTVYTSLSNPVKM